MQMVKLSLQIHHWKLGGSPRILEESSLWPAPGMDTLCSATESQEAKIPCIEQLNHDLTPRAHIFQMLPKPEA